MDKICIDFMKTPGTTLLVSYMRTGTHWLMCCIEEYFKKYCLLEGEPLDNKHRGETDVSKFILLHRHDTGLNTKHDRVIYLYRNPVDVIFSNLAAEGKLGDEDRLRNLATFYKKHIDKWLYKESFTTRKTIVYYDDLVANFVDGFSPVISHFGLNPKFNINKTEKVKSTITKEYVRKRFPKYMSADPDYENKRKFFRDKHGEWIEDFFRFRRGGEMIEFKHEFVWEDTPDVCGKKGEEFVLFLNGVKLWAEVHMKNYPPEEAWSGFFCSPSKRERLFIKTIKGKKELAMNHLISCIKKEIKTLGGNPEMFITMQPTKAERRRMYGLPAQGE